MILIKDLYDGEHIFSQFLVSSVAKCASAKGKNYLNVTLQDCSGEILGKRWEILAGDETLLSVGSIVSIEGDVLLYNGSLQLNIRSVEPVEASGIDYSRFVMQAPVDFKTLEAKLDSYLSSFENDEISVLTNHLIEKYREKYVNHPAAVRNHHAYLHGLLFHSLSMADLGEAVCRLYPSLNRDILIAGALLHDLGKVIELSGPVGTKYTVEGKLLGHISIMVAEIRMAAQELKIEGEVPLLLEHMILSHHGKPEYGSPVHPLTREALALSMIDDFDAKMGVLDRAEKDIVPGDFTQRIFALDDSFFYVPKFDKEK